MSEERKKGRTYAEDIDRSIYDLRNEGKDIYRIQSGLTPGIIREISKTKSDPAWMLEHRLKPLETFERSEMPVWDPSTEGLNTDKIATYVRPNVKTSTGWLEVLEEIKDAPKKLGIPKAERENLAGVGAQYGSELAYHNVKKEVVEQGVIYTDLESVMYGPYEQMIRDHFMKFVPPTDHKSAASHGAVWSGGSFVYVSPGVRVEIPLQSYSRLNTPGAGQLEYTLIIVDGGVYLHFIKGCSAPKYNVASLYAGCVELFADKRTTIHYSTIENWSKNMYNLNTKRTRAEEDDKAEWISGSFGSHVGYFYPMSVLVGDRARPEFPGVTFAGVGQNLNIGYRIMCIGKNTNSYVSTRSISKSGGISTFHLAAAVQASAENAKNSTSCQSLMLGAESRSDTTLVIEVKANRADMGHEARIGRTSDDAVFYLMSCGVSEEDARVLIVSSFADNVGKESSLEYAVETNNLTRLGMRDAIG